MLSRLCRGSLESGHMVCPLGAEKGGSGEAVTGPPPQESHAHSPSSPEAL